MPAKPALEPVFDPVRSRWRVDVPASKTASGRRVRAHFRTRQAARDYIDRIDGPSPSAIIDPRLANDAETARQRIEAAGFDLTLAEVAAAYVEAVKQLDGVGSLLEAATSFRSLHEARIASRHLGDAITAFLDAKSSSLRPATSKSYTYTLEKTMAPLHGKLISDITSEELAGIFGEKKPTARAMHVRNLRVFWKWVTKEPRGWGSMEVVDALEFRKDAGEGDIAILRPEEVQELLNAAQSFSAAAAIAFAISIFAGVRQAELERLTWSDIHEEHIEIGASIAKKARRRLIPISPTLRSWIERYRPSAIINNELVVGPNWREVSCAVRRLAGWNVASRLLQDPPGPHRGRWPANAPRHTCASILVVMGEPLETLIFQFGHSGGHDLLKRHYVGRLTKKDAMSILSLAPHNPEGPEGERAAGSIKAQEND